ncbi:acetaldehyde dehydrogenase (acetylating) [Clostridium tetanomorphum]|uniref:Acetaldehyde dehydrogenase (Acetylating) n=1 Tax=Clostridium tetanomorphum TaxID=1553 RepID=A0A923E8W3_CLOTT|nr:acetaldehyde dehydrogenase (acetylating) [Clostridium tetanomorphum]KAJ52575.1 acetaldehyde dehydrogenase / alcohol dehydrogenase-like protein [Clostridium tetanomorphum DSM 665]MBC2396871.1 acetaldehyde dehydrogenase (acetylating) [Clostridium tetanomorphum]MBP1863167.1 acetaldehyde dehydrogenase (acetylating) [Clostridium tetanomorphum]NRS84275.1 acetaldehyde dehydrogenase (acetylating) [Clostridium tetanomorphum]NRZ97489.1 acetaldehyde dehydrogenase (acetylating) [Clostridium tetanomorph
MDLIYNDLKSIQEVRCLIERAKKAQKIYCELGQEKIDYIAKKVAEAGERNAETLAKLAVEETGFGKYKDKIIKNKFASRVVYESIKNLKTIGIIKEDMNKKVVEIGTPVGVIAGLIPSTNPTSTAIYKSLISLKAGNAIIFSPHPNAKNCIIETVNILSKAAVEAGAPEGIIGCMTIPTMEGTDELMKNDDVALILATGGSAMVKAAYSSGTPAIGVGPGNGPAFIEKSADIKKAVKRIIDSKTFDNGVICASEQSIVVEECIREEVIEELKAQKCYFLNTEEGEKVSKFILRVNGTMNPQIVGKAAKDIANMAGISIPSETKVLIYEQEKVGKKYPFSREKLAPLLAFYTEKNWEEACEKCIEILNNEGIGHTLIIHSNNEEVIKAFALKKPVSRILVNTPGALGGIGGTTNLLPALTLGCGAVGGSATSDNVSPLNLINIRRLAYGARELEDLKPKESPIVNDELISEITKLVLEKLNS